MQQHNCFRMLLYKLRSFENLSIKLSVKTVILWQRTIRFTTSKEDGAVRKICLAVTYIDYVWIIQVWNGPWALFVNRCWIKFTEKFLQFNLCWLWHKVEYHILLLLSKVQYSYFSDQKKKYFTRFQDASASFKTVSSDSMPLPSDSHCTHRNTPYFLHWVLNNTAAGWRDGLVFCSCLSVLQSVQRELCWWVINQGRFLVSPL